MAIVDDTRHVRIDVPHETDDGAWFAFRPLNWVEERDARDAAEAAVVAKMRDWQEVLAGMPQRDRDGGQAADRNDFTPESFDTAMLLEASIVDWSYDADVSAENIAKLDGKTTAWAKKEAIKLITPDTEEDDQKN